MSIDLEIDNIRDGPNALGQTTEIGFAGLDSVLRFIRETGHRWQFRSLSSASSATPSPTSAQGSLRSSASSGGLPSTSSRPAGSSGSRVALL